MIDAQAHAVCIEQKNATQASFTNLDTGRTETSRTQVAFGNVIGVAKGAIWARPTLPIIVGAWAWAGGLGVRCWD